MSLPPVTVIVVSFNGRGFLGDCLGSLQALDYPRELLEILLVDNGSGDGSAQYVQDTFPSVRVLRLDANYGFAEANNRGAAAARGEFLALLNNDMRVRPDWVAQLVDRGLRHRDNACVASTILSWDGKSVDFADAGMTFAGWGSQIGMGLVPAIPSQRGRPILFACGGALLIPRQTYLDLGGLDPAYFAYFEDVDLGWRLWNAGGSVVTAPDAVVYHHHHGTGRHIAAERRWMYLERNALYTIIKNYGDTSLCRALPAALLLMAERAFVALGGTPATGLRRTVPAAAGRVGLGEYARAARIMVRQGGLPRVAAAATGMVRRRAARLTRLLGSPPTAAFVGPQDGAAAAEPPAPVSGYACLQGAAEVLGRMGDLRARREAVQSGRSRTDREVFPLFRVALESNFDDRRSLLSMEMASGLFGLPQLFSLQGGPADQDKGLVGAGWAASVSVLRTLDLAWRLFGEPVRSQRPGGRLDPDPAAGAQAMAVLEAMDRLFWSLPEPPLAAVLAELEAGCHRIIEAYGP